MMLHLSFLNFDEEKQNMHPLPCNQHVEGILDPTVSLHQGGQPPQSNLPPCKRKVD